MRLLSADSFLRGNNSVVGSEKEIKGMCDSKEPDYPKRLSDIDFHASPVGDCRQSISYLTANNLIRCENISHGLIRYLAVSTYVTPLFCLLV